MFYELSAEMAYPGMTESTSVGLVAAMNNFSTAVFLFIPASAHGIMNAVGSATMLLVLILLFQVREEYHRLDNEESKPVDMVYRTESVNGGFQSDYHALVSTEND